MLCVATPSTITMRWCNTQLFWAATAVSPDSRLLGDRRIAELAVAARIRPCVPPSRRATTLLTVAERDGDTVELNGHYVSLRRRRPRLPLVPAACFGVSSL